MNEYSIYAQLAKTLIESDAHKATKIISDKRTIVATRRLTRGKIYKNKRFPETEILFTDSRPNFENRKFIKICKRAGEPFPIKKIQLKFPPKKRK